MPKPIKRTRREMLKATAATCAAPYLITSTALGDNTTPPASERVLIGHIGVGGRGRSLFRSAQQVKTMQSVATTDCYKSRREGTAASVGGKSYDSYVELLEQDLDGVIIATPDHWHVALAIAAVKAGKDAYVEKPLGVRIEEDLLCRDTFKKNNRVFQYGTQQRSMGAARRGCLLVRGGYIGEVKRIEVIAPNGGKGGSTEVVPVPEDLNYDMWCGPSPLAPYSPGRCRPPGTYMIYDYSIGYLGGWGAHPLDMMILGSDADQSGLIEIEGKGEIPTEGLLNTVLNWDMTGKFGDVEFTFKPGRDSTRFIGTEGEISVGRNWLKCSNEKLSTVELKDFPEGLNGQGSHIADFVDCIKTRKQTRSHVSDAIRSDTISLLCDMAVRLDRKVTWDPKKEEIVGDAEAAAYSKLRPQREKWAWKA